MFINLFYLIMQVSAIIINFIFPISNYLFYFQVIYLIYSIFNNFNIINDYLII
jgi:hypothetical protein